MVAMLLIELESELIAAAKQAATIPPATKGGNSAKMKCGSTWSAASPATVSSLNTW